MHKPIRLEAKLPLLLFPVALLLIGRAYLSQIMPFYAGAAGYDQDPAYVYLLSGLTLLQGHAPHHTDHPGTPLQLLCALVEAVQWLYYRAANLTDQGLGAMVMTHAESCIKAVVEVLLALNAAALYYFGRRILQTTGSTLMALFAQTAPLLFLTTAPRIAYLSPEGLLVFASLCMLGLLAPFILNAPAEQPVSGLRVAPWAGVLCGFGVAVKVTFVPMAGLLLLLGSREAIARSLKYAALAFLICILPIATRVVKMIFWFGALATHTGHYGTGNWGLFDMKAIPSRIAGLATAFPALYIVAALLAIYVAREFMGRAEAAGGKTAGFAPEPGNPGSLAWGPRLRTPLVLLAIIVVQTVLVIKQFRYHYMLPVLPLTVVGAIWLAQSGAATMLPKTAFRALQAGLLGLALVLSAVAGLGASSALHASRLHMDASLAAVEDELKQHPDALVIGTYHCSLPECALAFGASYAPELEPQLAPILSHFLYYQLWAGNLTIYGEGTVPLQRVSDLLAAHREIFLVSPGYPQLSAFKLTEIIKTPVQSLYRVTGLAEGTR
jgi:hypothetical protein